MATFFTSDAHHRHRNVIEYSNRPWTFDDQTEELIKRWNARVGMNDTVYSLGDFIFGGPSRIVELVDIIKQLNGAIHFIKGNHCDKRLWAELERIMPAAVESVGFYKEIKINRTLICMSHYPMTIWNNAHHGTWMLHGHSHGSFQGNGKILDVGIDNHPERTVWSLDEVREHMAGRQYVAMDHHAENGR